MIESLTEEQEAQVPVYRDKWHKIGTSLGPWPDEETDKLKELFCLHYEEYGQKPPSRFMFFQSPMAGAYASAVIYADPDPDIDYVYEKVARFVEARFDPKMIQSTKVNQHFRQCGYGSHDANWLAFYDFVWNVVGIDECKKLRYLFKISELSGWWWPFEDICVVTHRPTVMHLDDQNRPSRDGGPAFEYGDGWGFWALNGVIVPRWLAETHKSKLDAKRVLSIRNADIRTEGIRKFGIERLAKDYGVVIDTLDDEVGGRYDLIDMSKVFSTLTYAPYLKMESVSVKGLFHLHGVDPSIRSVKAALDWYGKREWAPKWGA